MGENSNIEWCDSTFNGWIGCTKVSPGCANCYAETLMDTRWGKVQWGKGKPRQRTSEANWKQPIAWNKKEEIDQKCFGARRPRVFCSSLSDWLDDEVPIEWLADLLALIHSTPNLDWLMLSKRPENWGHRVNYAAAYLLAAGLSAGKWAAQWTTGTPPHNVWIGTTVENQEMSDKRIPQLLQIPAKVRFLSCEPLLEPVRLLEYEEVSTKRKWLGSGASRMGSATNSIDWIICGGESGQGARPMNPAWARSLRDQCSSAGVPFFMKQMGGTRKPFAPIPDDLNIRQFPTPFTPPSGV